GGRALLHDPIFMQVIVKGLIMKALWQIKLFTKFAKKIIIFLDEPYLAGFGSAYTPINREDIVNGLTELTTAIKSENVYVGVHCCGNTDWSIFTGIKTIDIINFDAFNFLEKFTLYADSLKGFLKRGGIICWGIVPTQEFSGRETAESLKKKIDHGIDILLKKGLDKDLLLNNLLISPACGLGTLESAKAENILKMLSEISYLIRK
ncbi:MAG: methionine synthase, partial [Candidatus Omnitrophota bacterium]